MRRWRELSPHLDRVLELVAEERAAWLAELRVDDPALAAEIDALLDEGRQADAARFLEEGPAAGSAATPAGQRVGAYTLLEPIGAGGMGTVWLARRSDGRYEGTVAVKLLNTSLVGRAGEERFRREGNILARLTHPNVARLIDAGVSSGGQPYLVLERVEGDPIDRYCDDRNLPVELRLRLFLDVLAAVAHAHANLIVHRDLKPSNVLVSAEGRVKLLDFGIAKLIDAESVGGEATALTRDGGRALTPRYAAPEQLTGGAITTATDVYGLGVLLYLLLGGRHPASAVDGSPADLVRAIIDTEPQRLSDVVSDERTATSEALNEVASRRASSPERLRRLLRGDLETIVAEALKKKPEERYGSVAELGDDLRRYLARQPIRARPDAFSYRAAKFVRRHRLPVALGGLCAAALLAGIAGTLLQARRAERQAAVAAEQRDFALRQLSRAEAINELNSYLLTEAAPGGKAIEVGELLSRAENIARRHGDSPHGPQLEMMIAVGRELHSHDEIHRARELLTMAYERSRSSGDVTTRARAACALALTLSRAGDLERAEQLVKEGLELLPDEPIFALPRIDCLRLGGAVAREAADDAELGLARALEAERLLHESGQGSPLLEVSLAFDLAESYRMAGRGRQASAAFARIAARLDALGYGDSELAGTLYNNWALAVRSQGKPLESVRLFERAVEIGSATRGVDSVTPYTLTNLAYNLADLDRLDEAKGFAERAFEIARRQENEGPLQQALLLRARICLRLGEVDEAARLMAALEQRLRDLPSDHLYRIGYESQAGLLAEARGDLAAGLAAHGRAIDFAEHDPARAQLLGLFLLRRSAVTLRLGEADRAREDAARALELMKREVETGSPSFWVGRAHFELARALRALGEDAGARAELAAAIEHLEPTLGPEHPESREARRLAADLAAPGTPEVAGTPVPKTGS